MRSVLIGLLVIVLCWAVVLGRWDVLSLMVVVGCLDAVFYGFVWLFKSEEK
jgi:hypothetical protein